MELGKRALGESSFLTVFTAWALWLLCPPQSLPGMWNLVFHPRRLAGPLPARGLQRCHRPLSVLYPVPPRGIGHSRAPLCPPLSQELRGSNALLHQSAWMTHTFHGKNGCRPDPCKGTEEGDATQMHTKPGHTGAWRTSESRFILSIWKQKTQKEISTSPGPELYSSSCPSSCAALP